jgi:hypothetical protein
MSPEEVKDLRRWLDESGGIAEGKPFLGERSLDAMMDAMMEMAAQIWVLKRRNTIVEALLEEKGCLSQDAIEAFSFTAEQAKQQRQIRAEFVSTIFRAMEELPIAAND